MATVRVTIDGRPGSFADSTTILAAARQFGIEIPTLCDDPRLEPTGACRLCLVEVAGAAKPLAACAAPVTEGMEIRTTSALLEAERRAVLEMLALDYPAAAILEAPDKPFHRYLRAAGITADGPSAPAETVDESHPYLRADMSRCIDCYRCVRICDDLQGQDVWHLWDRGAETVRAAGGPSLLESSVRGVRGLRGHLSDGRARGPEHRFVDGAAETWTRTVCPYCGVGCELDSARVTAGSSRRGRSLDGRANNGQRA